MPEIVRTPANPVSNADLVLEAVGGELERAAVLSYGADNILGHSIRNLPLYFECDLHLGTLKRRDVLDDFLGNHARITADAEWIKFHRSMESAWTD